MASPSDTANVQADEPLIALMYDHDGNGGYYAQARVVGLKTEAEALAAVAHLQEMLCSDELKAN